MSKFLVVLTFTILVILFELTSAIIINIAWGLLLIGSLSFKIAKATKISTWKVITEYINIAIIVVILTHFIGHFVGKLFV